MRTEPHFLIDRVAITFGAAVFGFVAAFVVAFPIYLFIGLASSDPGGIASLLFWKVPISFGLSFGILGLISPEFAADCLGKTWKGVVYVWRGIGGV